MPKKGRSTRTGLGPSRKAVMSLARNSMSAGVKPHELATLTYPVYANPGASVAGVNAYQFRMNSLFDPDFTATGSQPTTFDQWSTLYSRYRVLACHVDLDCVNVSSAIYVRACCAPSEDASPTLTWNGIAGLRDAHIPSSSGAGYVCPVRKTYSVADVFGIDEEALMSETGYSALTSANPARVAYLNIGIATSATTDVTQLIGFLKFAVRFEDPVANNISLSLAVPRVVYTAGPPASSQSGPQSGSFTREGNSLEGYPGLLSNAVGVSLEDRRDRLEERIAEARATFARDEAETRARSLLPTGAPALGGVRRIA